MNHLINRRRFLKIGALVSASVFAGIKLPNKRAFPNVWLEERIKNYHFYVGDFNCIVINDFNLEYQTNRLFVDVPENILTQKLKKYKLQTNHIPSSNSCLLINTNKNLVLIDTGAGSGVHPEIGPYDAKLLKSLRNAGVKAEDIDTVILTHGHWDHIGGITNTEGYINFPKARFYIFNEEWRFWLSKTAQKKQSKFLVDFARKKLIPLRDKIKLLNFDSEILPGIKAVFAPGHTPGHMVVILESKGKQLLYTADTVIHSFFLEEPEWKCGYDINYKEALITRQKLFSEKIKENALVLASHFYPFPGLGQVIKKEKGWKWKPI